MAAEVTARWPFDPAARAAVLDVLDVLQHAGYQPAHVPEVLAVMTDWDCEPDAFADALAFVTDRRYACVVGGQSERFATVWCGRPGSRPAVAGYLLNHLAQARRAVRAAGGAVPGGGR